MQTNKMKQKIMVNGVSYELQSIFGMDQNDKRRREVTASRFQGSFPGWRLLRADFQQGCWL